MNIDKITEKSFRKFDLLIFVILLALSLVLFLAVSITKKGNVEGFKVLVDNELVCSFDFENQKLKIANGKESFVEKLDENSYKISSSYGYNIIEIDNKNKDVFVIESDCGRSGECKKMNLKNGSILCVPHRFAVVPLNKASVPKIG